MGINGSYVDNVLQTGGNKWMIYEDAALERFETTGNDQSFISWARMHITEKQDMLSIAWIYTGIRSIGLAMKQSSVSLPP